MTNTQQIKQQTQAWINSVIVHYNICPFAKKVMDEKSVYYRVDEAQSVEEHLQTLIEEVWRLDNDEKIATTLLIYPDSLADFADFLNYLDLAEQLLSLQGYDGIYQLASFHPRYCFDGADETDAANYTNRSPYPMLHLIREADIEKALKNYPHPETIPERNIQLTRELGLSKMQSLLAACLSESEFSEFKNFQNDSV